MNRLKTISLISFFAFFVALAVKVEAQTVSCSIAADAFREAVQIRGLSKLREVPCLVNNKEEVSQYLRATINTKVPQERLANEELIFKGIGLIPEKFDYKQGLINLYLSQLGGYYDPDKRHYVMAGWLPGALQEPIAVHELTHSLQDQHYNLQEFVRMENFTTDELQARSALVEGDATAVMYDYMRRLVKQPPLREENDVEGVILQSVFGMQLGAMQSSAPQSLQLMLLFPYTSGLRFVHQRLRAGGYKSVDEVFLKPPQSSAEILHPEKYGKKNIFVKFSPGDVASDALGAEDWKVTHEDVLGEFGIAALLAQLQVPRDLAASIAAGWAGDRIVLRQHENKKLIIWRTHWDSTEHAKKFFESYHPPHPQAYKIDGADVWLTVEVGI